MATGSARILPSADPKSRKSVPVSPGFTVVVDFLTLPQLSRVVDLWRPRSTEGGRKSGVVTLEL